jgi:hypothetical protein
VPENKHPEQNVSGYDPNNAMVTAIATVLLSSACDDKFLSLESCLVLVLVLSFWRLVVVLGGGGGGIVNAFLSLLSN